MEVRQKPSCIKLLSIIAVHDRFAFRKYVDYNKWYSPHMAIANRGAYEFIENPPSVIPIYYGNQGAIGFYHY
ncbi:unnamed protein product [Nippostrongylus brasiliensis]|uniref:Uncharacterized protein n=1 Tax=Nippostrongylus brasiliensis TaxID=27835 RepID=A0A0N4XUF5_NIPBR|nr:unnamed protein product [Nippostrongylus brasiliensis]